eukprot:2693111-Pyramimonas_sp.AAC.1
MPSRNCESEIHTFTHSLTVATGRQMPGSRPGTRTSNKVVRHLPFFDAPATEPTRRLKVASCVPNVPCTCIPYVDTACGPASSTLLVTR